MIHYRRASQSYKNNYYNKLNAKWSNKYHLQHSESRNKAQEGNKHITNILGHGEYNKYDKQMISKILVAMDGSESSLRAYEYASFLAKRCDAALIIMNICGIFEKITGEIKRELGDIAKKIEAEGGTGISIQLLEDYKSQAKDSGIKDVKTIRREGNTAAEILYIANEENVDTIVIGSKGVKSVKEFLLGGVSDKVIHHRNCPVTVIR